jgi:hypothetical protein
MKGEIQITLRDRQTGAVKYESPWIPNNKSRTWTMRGVIESMTRGTHATALRSVSKPDTGQFAEALSQGQFGVYVLNGIAEGNLDVNCLVPPYVDESHTTLNDKVGLYNVNNATIETAQTMIADDKSCRYSYDPKTATYTIKYIKTTGTAQFGGIAIGRVHSDPTAHFGYLLSEYAPRSGAASTSNYLLEHRTDRTIIWKAISGTQQFAQDLLTKQVATYSSVALHTNIERPELSGGMVFGLLAVKATRQAHSSAAVTVRLTAVKNFLTEITVVTRDIVFTAEAGSSIGSSAQASPVMVARPDLNGFEVFVAMELSSGACCIKKATVTNLEDGIDDADIVITDVAELPYLISKTEDDAITKYVTGYYDVVAKRYYLPYSAYVDDDGNAQTIQTTNYQPGLIYNEDFSTLLDRYYARLNNNCHIPVKTDSGVLYCRAGTASMYYFQGHCMIAGTIFDEVYTKPIDDIFELTYRFSFT